MKIADILKTLLGRKKHRRKIRKSRKNKERPSGRKKRSRGVSKTRKKIVPASGNKKRPAKKKKASNRIAERSKQKKKNASVRKDKHKHRKSIHSQKEVEAGVVTHYFNRISVAVIKLKVPLKIGDKIRIKGRHSDFTQSVSSMQINHQPVSYANRGMEIGLKVNNKVRENDRVYKLS